MVLAFCAAPLAQQVGKRVFDQHCAACHGANGDGNLKPDGCAR
jgi:mono/diheme cytochrome c family protein